MTLTREGSGLVVAPPVGSGVPAVPGAATVADADQEARATLARHGRSFFLASHLLSPEHARDAARCYAFCREADDLVDEAPSLDAGRAAIQAFDAELRGLAPARASVAAWRELEARDEVPRQAALDLVETIGQDAGPVRIADDAALRRYAYGVAGTVGLMMAAILGARAPVAHAAAVELGIAMQLTNIARDVGEDAARDRVYLPASRLRAAGIDPEAVVRGQADPAALSGVVRQLVADAEVHYERGIAGLVFLPWRAGLAIAVAASLYRAIGHKVVRRGVEALERRTVLGRLELLRAGLRGLGWLFSRDVPPLTGGVVAYSGVGRS